MQTVTIEQGPVTFPAGSLLKLSDDQARRRRHLVEPAGTSGVFRALAPVQFKSGETLATDADIPKSLNDRVKVAGAAPRKSRKATKTAPPDDSEDSP